MQINLKSIIKTFLVSLITLMLALPAHAQVIFDNEFLLQEVGGSWIIDAGDDAPGDVSLQFGNTLGETLTFNTTDNWFELSDDLNLFQNQLKNIAIDNLASAPSTPVAGQIYHNTTDGNTYIWNGSAWEDITAAAGGGGSQDFESVYSNDTGNNLDTGGAIFTIDTTNGGSGDFVVTSTDWSINATGDLTIADITSTGVIDFTGSTEFHIREVANEGAATCTTVNEIVLDTTEDRLYVCTITGSPGIWVATDSNSIQDLEEVFTTDSDNTLTTTNSTFTINTGTADFVITANNWTVDASGNVSLNNLTISTGTAIANHISTTVANVTSASISAKTCDDYATETVTGATVGDTVFATPQAVSGGIETVNLSWQVTVSATNTVLIRACNPEGNGSINTADIQTWRFDIWQH